MLERLKSLSYGPNSKKYFLSTSWLLFEKFLTIGSGIFFSILFARYLGPAGFGEYNYYLALYALAVPLSNLGMESILSKELVLNSSEYESYMGSAFGLKFLVAAIINCFMLVSYLVNPTQGQGFLVILSLGLTFQALDVIEIYFRSQSDTKFLSYARMVQVLISSALKFYILENDPQLWKLFSVFIFDLLAYFFILWFAYLKLDLKNFIFHFDRAKAIKMMKESWPLILSGLAIIIFMRIDQIMIHDLLGEKEVGEYSAAIRISEGWYFFPVIITSALFPAILKSKVDSEIAYKKTLGSLYRTLVYLGIFIAVVITFLSKYIVVALFDQAYIDAADVLTIHIWTGVFVCIGLVNIRWLILENLQVFSTGYTIIGAFLNIGLNLILIPELGIKGAAIATLISQSASGYFCLLLHHKTRQSFFFITRAIFLGNTSESSLDHR
jgi:O-antigen/teichoic acid export membrane protein